MKILKVYRRHVDVVWSMSDWRAGQMTAQNYVETVRRVSVINTPFVFKALYGIPSPNAVYHTRQLAACHALSFPFGFQFLDLGLAASTALRRCRPCEATHPRAHGAQDPHSWVRSAIAPQAGLD